MNKVVLITGASRGLGQVLAAFFAARGDHLILTARREGALQAAARSLAPGDSTIITLTGDVSDPLHRQRLIDAARELGGLDLLINNASMLGPSPQPALLDYPLLTLRQVFETNVFAPLALIQQAAPLLQAQRGMVINISSDAAVGGYEGWGGYGASKAALDLITLTLANELRSAGISVVAVDPGDMRTEMHQAAFPGEDISDRPLPEVTIPFWAWLLGQDPASVSGRRFQAQAETWLVSG